MGKDTVTLNLAAELAGGTKQAFRAVADGFKLLGKEVKNTALALSKAGKTEAADMMGHLSMAIDRVSGSAKEFNKTGKATRDSLDKTSKAAKDYSKELEVVQKAHAKWSNSGKATGTTLQVAQRRTDLLSKSIAELGATMKQGGASTASIEKWKESLDFSKVWSGMRTGALRTTATGFKELGAEGRKLLGIQSDLEKSMDRAGASQSKYHAQLTNGKKVSAAYTKAVKALGEEQGKNNVAVDRWAPALKKVNTAMTSVRENIGKAANSTRHWTRTTQLANITQGVLQGNIQATSTGFKILNEKGLKQFNGLSYKAADSMKMLSSRFDNLSVKTGAQTLTDYGKAVDAARGQTDKFSKGLTQLASKHGVSSAAFRSQYEDMKKSDSIWNKHVTTLEKTGRVSAETAKKMRTGFNAAKTSSVKLAESLGRPSKQFAELEKTINRVSVATGKSTDAVRAQATSLKDQGLSHQKVVNALNSSVGAHREYSKISDKIKAQERELANLRGTSVNSIRKVSSAILDGAKSEQQLIKVGKIRSDNLKDQITAQKNVIATEKKVAEQKVRLVNKYRDLIGVSSTFDRAIGATANRYRESTAAGQRMAGNLDVLANRLRASQKEASLFGRAIQSVGTHIKSFASYATAASFIAGIVGGFQQATVAVVEFDQALKDLQAITGATDREVEVMGATIKQVASTTKFSASEVAAGMKTLGQAGLSSKEAVQAIGSVADLATGTLSDMATGVDLVTTAMRVFDIQAADSQRIADVFANAVNRSKLTVEKLRVAFNYVGPIAARAGVQFEEVAGSMMLLANSGIRASTIGTGLRQVFSKLVKPTAAFKDAVKDAGFSMEDFNLKTNSMRTVIERLSSVVTDAETAFKYFGLRGASAVSALTQSNVAGFDAMMQAVSQTGTAAKMAAKQMEGLGVRIKNMWDKAKNLAITLGETGLAGALGLVVDATRWLIDLFIALAGNPITGFIVKVGMLVGVLLTFTVAVRALIATKLAGWFVTAATGATGFSATMVAATAAVRTFLASIPLVGWALIAISVALTSAISLFKSWRSSIQDSYNDHKTLAEGFDTLSTKIDSYNEKVVNLEKGSKDYNNANLQLRAELAKVSERFDVVGTMARSAELSINALTGEFYDGGEAVKAYHAKLKELESVNLNKANEAASKALASSMGAVNETFDKLKGTLGSIKDGVVAFAKTLTTLPFDNEAAAGYWVEFMHNTEEAWKANVKLNDVVGKFEQGEASFKELKTVLLDSKVASSEFGKELIKAMALTEEAASKTIDRLLKLGEIDMKMSNEEITAIAKSLGMIKDETGAVAQAMKYLADVQREAMGDAVTGLASRWKKELGDITKTFDGMYQAAMDSSDEATAKFLKDNEEVIRGFEERKRALADSVVKVEDDLAETKDYSAYTKAMMDLNEDAKRLQQEMRANDKQHQHLQIQQLKKSIEEQIKKNDLKFESNLIGEMTYYRKSEELAREYIKKYEEIMGDRLDPEEAKLQYKKFTEMEQSALAAQLLALETQHAKGLISEGEYQSDKYRLIKESHARIEAEAKRHYALLKKQSGSDTDKDTASALKTYKDAEQSRMKSDLAAIKYVSSTREKLEKKIANLLKKRTKEQSINSKNVIKIEADAAAKIEKIHTALNAKIEKLLKKRAEVNKQGQADIQSNHASIADKIRSISQRGMDEVQKEYDNAAWAQEKYITGLRELERANVTGDKATLDRARQLLEESSGIYENLSDNKKAISGISKVGRALDSVIRVDARIETGKIDAEIAAEKKKANTKIEGIEKVKVLALAAEKVRHEEVMKNLAIELGEQQKLYQGVLNMARQLDLSNVKFDGATTGTTDTVPLPSQTSDVPASVPQSIKKVGDEWVNATTEAGNYNKEVDKSNTVTPKTGVTITRVVTGTKQVNAMIKKGTEEMGLLKIATDEVANAIAEIDAKSNIEPVMSKELIDQVIIDYEAKLDEMNRKADEEPIEIIKPEQVKKQFEVFELEHEQTNVWLTNNPLEVIVEMSKAAYDKLKKQIEELRRTKIKVSVSGDSTSSASAPSADGMFDGGKVGGPNARSSTRDTRLIKARMGEWFVNNEAGDYWGDSFMQGIAEPFSEMGRVISSVVNGEQSMGRTSASASRKNSESMLDALSSFGTVNVNLPEAGPPVSVIMRQSDMGAFVSGLKKMGKMAS